MDVLDCIADTYAVRTFRDETVSDETVQLVVRAAGQAGSGKNRQPWTFVAVRDEDTLRELAAYGAYTDPLTAAPMGIVLAVHERDSQYGLWNNIFDCGRAGQNLVLAAATLGLGTVPQAIRDREAAGACLELPDHKHVLMVFAVGYPQSTEGSTSTPDIPAEVFRGKNRKPVEDILHWERHP